MNTIKSCPWCGKSRDKEGQFCPHCDRPIHKVGYGITILKIIVLSFTIPVAIAIVGWQFQISQRNLEKIREDVSLKIDDRRRLAQAYTNLNDSIGRFRAAIVQAETACQGQGGIDDALCFKQLKRVAFEIDGALTSIGSHLAPFIEYASRTSERNKVTKVEIYLEIEATWQRCFVNPYYKGSFSEKSLWQQFNEVFTDKICTENDCGYKAAMAAKSIADRIWNGQCLDAKPEQSRPLTWFSDTVKELYSENFRSHDDPPNTRKREQIVNDGLSPEPSKWMKIIWDHYNNKRALIIV